MKEYTVYFEIFGKKMKTKIQAYNVYEAQNIVKNSIKFHKVEAEDSTLRQLKNIFGMK